MNSYMAAWRIFRRLSDENGVTAQHLISRTAWPKKKTGYALVDFGCGDGRLAEAVAVESPSQIGRIHLIDPDEQLLQEAITRLQGFEFDVQVRHTLARAEDVVAAVTVDADVALAVHMVYLLKESDLQTFLLGIAPGVPLFLVMDKQGSVFTKLWEKTAPRYHQRLIQAHRVIESLDRFPYSLARTEFDTHIKDPLQLRQDLRESILSLLCYRDFRDLERKDQEWAFKVLADRTVSGGVVCDCVCYELIRGR